LATLPESKFLEHKQTFSYNIHTKKKDPGLSDAVLDRVCSFWNAEGGTLLVGVEDRTGRIVGVSDDVKIFKDYDGLVKSVSDRLHQDVAVAARSITVCTGEASSETLLRIDVPAGGVAVYRRDRFFVRVNNTTQELKGADIQQYVKRRWREQ
jgi:predicted HTH transcriptional regulator